MDYIQPTGGIEVSTDVQTQHWQFAPFRVLLELACTRTMGRSGPFAGRVRLFNRNDELDPVSNSCMRDTMKVGHSLS